MSFGTDLQVTSRDGGLYADLRPNREIWGPNAHVVGRARPL
jgi:hypothetical protein